MNISSSLVLYGNNPNQYARAIQCFLDGCDGVLHVVDNSVLPLQHSIFAHPRIRYVYTGKNLGYGNAHNFALGLLGFDSDLHLLLNPDISFDACVMSELSQFMLENPSVGTVMPRINYPNGELQHLCKLLPTPLDLVLRRFLPSVVVRKKHNWRYEMHWLPQDSPSTVPTLSGCFLVVRTDLLKQLGGFDERFFMYMEDVDLVRRIGDFSQTVYFPLVNVTHEYGKGSYHSFKLLIYHIHSAIKYFNKWGWFSDKVRHLRNQNAINKASNKWT
jgi:GT2 family glycosyltransferase